MTPALVLAAALTAPSPPVFASQVRLVMLHPTVRNRRGELVTGLDQSAFTIYENGRRQPITVFRRDEVPASIGILIDNSGSMAALRAKVEAAALAFARACGPSDEISVINFADKPHVDVPFATDRSVLEAGVVRVDSIGGTALLDAVDAAETYLERNGRRDRRALLLITDGDDNASTATADGVRRRAEQAAIAIYAVGLPKAGDAGRARRARERLDDLAERTGGSVRYPPGLDDVGPAAVAIARQIRSEYTIGYAPLDQALDGSYRKVRVEARGPERFSVRARAGYRATPEARSQGSCAPGATRCLTALRLQSRTSPSPIFARASSP